MIDPVTEAIERWNYLYDHFLTTKQFDPIILALYEVEVQSLTPGDVEMARKCFKQIAADLTLRGDEGPSHKKTHEHAIKILEYQYDQSKTPSCERVPFDKLPVGERSKIYFFARKQLIGIPSL